MRPFGGLTRPHCGHGPASPISQRECSGLNRSPASVPAEEPVRISPDAVRRGTHPVGISDLDSNKRLVLSCLHLLLRGRIMETSWHYIIDGIRFGPVGQRELEGLITQGIVKAQTLIWREGLDGWEEAKHHFGFANQSSVPPPAPTLGGPPQMSTLRSVGSAPSRVKNSNAAYVGAPARSFSEAISVCFSKYVTFSGRASRSEFWWFQLFSLLVYIVAGVADIGIGIGLPLIALSSWLVLLLPHFTVATRRLHDTDRSGWWIGSYWAWLFGGIALFAVVDFSSAAQRGEVDEKFLLLVISTYLIGFFALFVIPLVFFCLPGNREPNRFG